MLKPTPSPVEDPPPARQAQPSFGAGNPATAAWLSLIPGLGQLYNRQPRKAIVFFLAVPGLFFGSFGIPGLTTELLAWWRPRGALQVTLSVVLELLSLLLFIGVFVAGLLTWYASIHDARLTAHERRTRQPTTGRWWLFRK